jgi:eukaryotic-like serine/threonine-protein kinase
MKSPDSDELERLFHAASALSTADRAEFLKAAGPTLANAVSAMIQGARDPLWDHSAIHVEARDTAFECCPPRPGDTFGPYRIVRRIAGGGMSFVYEAARDDAEFQKRVAIKFVRQGIDDEAGIERFRGERQILAQLEHPNIARLLDGGTTADGSPYLVMEFVAGVPVDRFAVEGALSRTQHIQLFLQVCEAVQYAHSNLVVHRDIKPANILVTADGVPKLLDFGIAKLLTGGPGGETVAALTPEYASPEQVLGRSITTATDIYSLGLLLFLLLADRLPYSATSPGELVHAICEEAPVWEPRGLIDGDLESVIAVCLRKEPEKRYPSVERLADDLRRYLEGLPVSARGGALLYRTAKFVRRRKLPLVAAAVVALGSIAGIVSIVTQSRRLERRYNQVRTLAGAVLFNAYDALQDLPGSLPARRLLADSAQQNLDTLAREAAGDRQFIASLAASYRRLGDVRGGPYGPNLGDTAGALTTYRKAEALLQAAVAHDPSDVDLSFELAQTRLSVARALLRQQELEAALPLLRGTAQSLQSLQARFPKQSRYVMAVTSAYQHLSECLAFLANRNGSSSQAFEALEFAQKGLEVYQTFAPGSGMEWQEHLSAKYFSVGYRLWTVAQRTGDPSYYRQALEFHLKGQAINNALAAAYPTRESRRLADGLLTVANTRWYCCRDTSRTLAQTQQALAMFQELVNADPQNAEARRDVANTLQLRGRVLGEIGLRREALAADREALAIYEDLRRADATDRENDIAIGIVNSQLAVLEERPR